MFTTSTLCSSGTIAKLTPCTHGHSIRLVLYAVQKLDRSFSLGSFPSMMDIEDRNKHRCVGVNTIWSVHTLATKVALVLLKAMLFCRNLNQVVAAGPKTAISKEEVNSFLDRLPRKRLNAYHHRKGPCVQCEQSCGSQSQPSRLHAVLAHLRLRIAPRKGGRVSRDH